MALLHSQTELQNLPLEKFSTLAGVVSRIGMATEVLNSKTGGEKWPEMFKKPPQRPPRPGA